MADERSSGEGGGAGGGLGRWLFLALAVVGLLYFLWPRITGKSKGPDFQPLTQEDWGSAPEDPRPDEELCNLTGPRSEFVVSTRGGAIKSAQMLDKKYSLHSPAQRSPDKPDPRIDLVTTSKEQRMPLRASLRAPSADAVQQVDFDNLDFKLDAAQSTESKCVLTYETATTKIDKTVSITERPFELDVVLTITNKSPETRKHRYAIEQTSWRSESETSSSFWDLGRRPEWATDVTTHTSKKTKRHNKGEFDPDDFDPKEGYTSEHFLRVEGEGMWVSVSSNYFASSVIHKSASTAAPAAEALIEDGHYYNLAKNDPAYGQMFRARLAYPEKELGQDESATYEDVAYFGPKEREVLTAVGGPDFSRKNNVVGLIDLGMFGFIGGVFVTYVLWLFKLVGSWGWAICLLTITVKIGVFPLMLPNLKTQVATRRLKPEIEEINRKYKDDMLLKQQAMSELYRKAGIRPMLGCLPMLLQMPVWISLYQALGTAVELYHTPFGPLIPDLTHADPYHVIPIVLGGSSFLQQKLMPAQGVDPAQQKMMLYMMPAIFTVMMFFLPAGLGVYMLTNTWLGIIQQFLVERWVSRKVKQPASIQVREIKKTDGDRESPRPALGKGKARARG